MAQFDDGLLSQLEAGNAPPLTLILGEEDWQAGRIIGGLTKSPAFGAMAEFNVSVLSAAQNGANEVLATAGTLPCLAEYRLVVVRDVDAWKADDKTLIMDYAADPAPTTCLVLTAAKLDGREKFTQTLKKQARVITLKRPRRGELIEMLADTAQERGKTLSRALAGTLLDRVGQGLGEAMAELDKVLLFAGDRKRITEEDVIEVTSSSRSQSIFELTDALGQGRIEIALGALGRLLVLGEPEGRVLFMVIRQMRMIWQAKDILQSGGGRGEVASSLRVPPFVAEKLVGQANSGGHVAPAEGLKLLAAADLALKGGAFSRQVVLEKLVLDLCRVGGKRRGLAARQ